MNDTSLPNTGDQSIEVPLESISVGGVAPEPGDTVDFAIEARVDRCENDCAYVTPVKVNGQEVESAPEDSGENGEEPLDAMGSRIRGMLTTQGGGY